LLRYCSFLTHLVGTAKAVRPCDATRFSREATAMPSRGTSEVLGWQCFASRPPRNSSTIVGTPVRLCRSDASPEARIVQRRPKDLSVLNCRPDKGKGGHGEDQHRISPSATTSCGRHVRPFALGTKDIRRVRAMRQNIWSGVVARHWEPVLPACIRWSHLASDSGSQTRGESSDSPTESSSTPRRKIGGCGCCCDFGTGSS
jgi:hypothetical protein